MGIIHPCVGRLNTPLTIKCECGHTVTWPRTFAIERLGYWTTPGQVASRLVCSTCGKRTFTMDGEMR